MIETTSTATIINNIILNFNLQVVINLFVYTFFAAAGGTAASKLVILLVNEFVKVIHERWLMRFKDKRNLAIEVIKICTEGSTLGWNVRPRDIEHIYYIARLLGGFDKKTSKLFDRCIGNWSLNAIKQEKQATTPENIKFGLELQKGAQSACEEIIKIISKWK